MTKQSGRAASPPPATGRLRRRWPWAVLGLLAVLVVSIASGACSRILPERFAVNVPIRHMLFGTAGPAPSHDQLGRLQAASGYRVAPFADGLPNVRFLRFSATGDLLASLPRSGRIVRIEPDRDGDGRSDGSHDLLKSLDRPHGIDLHRGWLYVAEHTRVFRVRFDDAAGQTVGEREVVVDDLPEGGNHWTRTVRIGPDGFAYVAVGSSCNVCEEEDPRRAAMLRVPAAGGEATIHADGLRNSVGFDWQPGTNALYATDNGRDLLGNDFPPCELNRIVPGGFYGWPYVNGFGVADPDFGGRAPGKAERAIDPAHGFGAHNAPLGITFVRNPAAPAWLRNAAVVALHGSWNRTRKDGYKVVSLHWQEDGRIEERDFVTGFEVDEDVIGRPVDVAEGPDGAFYVSDDYAGMIHRVSLDARSANGTASGASGPSARPAPLENLSTREIETANARGAVLWEAHGCASCHDASRVGAGVVAVSLSGLASRHTLDGLSAFLAAPTPPMPVPAVDAAERRDLAIHLLVRERSER